MTFEDYARSRLSAMLRTATAVTGDRGLAEEIVQDVLIKIARRWDAIEALEHRDAYVRRMLVNEFVSWRRKWSRLVPTEQIPAQRSEPDLAERSADRDLLRRELTRLPRRQQVVLALRYLDGLGDADIAAALGCGESTVRSNAARGLASLRVQLSGASAPATVRTTGGLP